MAPCQGTPITHRSGTLLFSRYPGCKILHARTGLRTRRQVGRPSPPHPSAPSRPGGRRYPTTQMARTSTARSSQPTYIATDRGMVGEQY
jgi:hypothetical protein